MTPIKSADQLQGHRSTAEKEQRRRAEAATLSGVPLRAFPQVEADPVALEEFNRVKALLSSIGRDDDLYAGAINTYALLHSEIQAIPAQIRRVEADLEDLESRAENLKPSAYNRQKATLEGHIEYYHRLIDKKRKMMREIENANAMNVKAAQALAFKEKDTDQGPMAILRQALASGG